MTVLITLTIAGTDSGPFNLYSNLDGYVTPFAINISKASLLSGYTSSVVPDFTNTIRVKSNGVCTNFIDIVLANTTTTTTSVPTTTTTTTSGITTTSTTTAAPAFHFLIEDCVTSTLYNAPIGGSGLGIGDVISYRPIGSPSALPRCGTITSDTFIGVTDATITGPNEGISRDCGDSIHCDLT